MNLSFLRPSGWVRAAEDIVTDGVNLVTTTAVVSTKWIKAKREARRVEQFKRDAKLAGFALRKARS